MGTLKLTTPHSLKEKTLKIESSNNSKRITMAERMDHSQSEAGCESHDPHAPQWPKSAFYIFVDDESAMEHSQMEQSQMVESDQKEFLADMVRKWQIMSASEKKKYNDKHTHEVWQWLKYHKKGPWENKTDEEIKDLPQDRVETKCFEAPLIGMNPRVERNGEWLHGSMKYFNTQMHGHGRNDEIQRKSDSNDVDLL